MLCISFAALMSLAALSVAHADGLDTSGQRRLLPIDGFLQVGSDLFGAPASDGTSIVEFGTTVALSTDDGYRMLVGAPGHDYSSATSTDVSFLCKNCGAIFLYDFNGTDWDLKSFLNGDPGEGIGRRADISADGSRIAVRRFPSSGVHPAEVYDVASDGTLSKVGSSIGCGDTGNAVSLSADGTIVAVSCETFGSNVGRVQIYTFVSTDWSLIGTVDGDQNNALFGGITAFNDAGDRIAISAQNHDSNGFTNNGVVRIFDYNTTDWNQVGSDIYGPANGGQFGYGLDISGDGASFVAGAPQSDASGIKLGLVQAYEFSTSWVQKGSTIEGVSTNDRFGWSIAVNQDGSRFVGSSYFHRQQRGHIVAFDFDGSDWTTIGSELEATNPQDFTGFGRDSVTITSAGDVFAYGIVRADDGSGSPTGLVRAVDFNIVPSSAPSAMPSTAPSSDPSSGPSIVPTAAPTTSSPSSSPSNILSTMPSTAPSSSPSSGPSVAVTPAPTPAPTTSSPSLSPSNVPSGVPSTVASSVPSNSPSVGPSPAPVTSAPTTVAPVTPAPATLAPVTTAPITPVPVITAPVTLAPVTSAPTIPAPRTVAPATPSPVTAAPVTPAPTTAAPVDSATPAPVTTTGGSKSPSWSTFPSFVPSMSNRPSDIPSNSISPSESLVPSTPLTPSTLYDTITPTVTLGKFEWDLERIGHPVITFDDTADLEEITLSYNISLRNTLVQVFEEDCLTTVPASVVGVAKSTTITSPTHGLLKVDLDIMQDSVVGSGIWIDGNGVGYVNLCVRVDLVLNDANSTSVNFHEQGLYVTIGLTQGFQVTQIDLERLAPDQKNSSVTANYDLYACQCNATYDCEDIVLAQGSDVYICVISNSTDVEIAGIVDLDFVQGNFSASVIVGGVEDALTGVLQTGSKAVIRSQLVSEFFTDSNPTDVLASGVASLEFVNSTRRVLKDTKILRAMQEVQQDDADFSILLGLKSTDESPASTASSAPGPSVGALIGGLLAAMVLVAMFAIGLFIANRWKRSEEDAVFGDVDQ